jgi:hypothetical protein
MYSGVSLASALLGGVVAFPLGYALAVMRRANKDYKTTKAAVGLMRKTFWIAWLAHLRAVAVVAAVLAVLVVWVVRDGQDDSRATVPDPTQPASSSVAR